MKSVNRLYHLSEKNHDGKIFRPIVPDALMCDDYGRLTEDNKTKRVCFSTSISGAFYAINFSGKYQELYVHIAEDLDEIKRKGKLYKPTSKQVSDVEYTDEYWVKCSVKMKCIGKIYIGYDGNNIYSTRPQIHFRYIEKY